MKKLTKEKRLKVKDAIEWFEYYRNGFHKFGYGGVKATCLEEDDEKYYAKITIQEYDEDYKRTEVYPNCWYEKDFIDGRIK